MTRLTSEAAVQMKACIASEAELLKKSIATKRLMLSPMRGKDQWKIIGTPSTRHPTEPLITGIASIPA